MCGRYQLTTAPEALRALFGYVEQPNFPPREAIAPTEPIAIVTDDFGTRHFMLVRWGFLPAFVKDAARFPLLFNARGETLAEKPAFRNAIRRRRCLVPASGFYEWRREGEGRAARKIPYLCTRADGQPLALAGIWETHVGGDGGEIDTAAIITTAANGTMAAIHERMPVIIEPEAFATWLDNTSEKPELALALVRPAAEDVLVIEEVDSGLPRPLRREPSAGRTASQPRPEPKRQEPKIPARDDPQGSLF